MQVLTENSLDKRINKLIKSYIGEKDFSEIRAMRGRLLNYIPNARIEQGKWMYATFQLMLDETLDFSSYGGFNDFLLRLSRGEIETNDKRIYEPNFGGLSSDSILAIMNENIRQNNAMAIGDINQPKVRKINGYTVCRLDNDDDARNIRGVFNEEWCIINDNEMLWDMTNEFRDTCYIVRNDRTYDGATTTTSVDLHKKLLSVGNTDLAEEIYDGDYVDSDIMWNLADENNDEYFDLPTIDNGLPPYDEYGLSAFVIIIGYNSIKKTSSYMCCYSRYNLPNCYDGHFLDKNEISQLIGKPFDEVFPFIEKNLDETSRKMNFDKIITEEINRFITEDYRQLSIPFDGNTCRYNYEYFIDYLEKIGKQGQLPPSTDDSISVGADEVLSSILATQGDWTVGNFLCKTFNCFTMYMDIKEPNKVDDDASGQEVYNYLTSLLPNQESVERFHDYLCAELRNYIQDNMGIDYDENGLIYVERTLNLDDFLKKPLNLHNSFYQLSMSDMFYKQGLGICWSWCKNGSAAYGYGGGVDVVVVGKVSPQSVDWDCSILLDIIYEGEEKELRIKKNQPIEVDAVLVNGKHLPLKQPLIVSSGVHV